MSQHGPVNVFSTTAMKTTLDALMPEFERSTGYRLACTFGPSGRVVKQIAEGADADIAISLRPRLEELIKQGKIVPDSVVNVARSIIAVAVQANAPKPDISTAEKLKQVLLDAKSIAMSSPVGGGASGAHLQRLLERFGIAETLKPKLIYGPGGPAGLIGLFLVRKEADLGIQQYSELLAVPGIAIVGPLPDECQETSVIAIGTHTGSKVPQAGRALRELLKTPAARTVLESKGLEPV